MLAEDFVCCCSGRPDQERSAFIDTLVAMPLAIVSVEAEQLAVRLFTPVAVLTCTQVARLRLPDGREVNERLALTNVFRQTNGKWQMALARPVTLPDAKPA